MLHTEKDELDELKEQITKLEQDKNEMAKTVLKLNEMPQNLPHNKKDPASNARSGMN